MVQTDGSLIERERSCLIVVDVQQYFLDKLPLHERGPLVQRMAWLMRVARALDIPIVATAEDVERNGPLVPDLAGLLPPETAVFNKMIFGLMSQADIRAAVDATKRDCFVLMDCDEPRYHEAPMLDASLVVLRKTERSLEFVRREFKTPSFLCPDMSIALGPLPRARPPRQDVVWLLREDVEARDHGASLAGVESEDWCGERRSWRFRLKRFVAEELSWHPRSPGWTWPLLAPVHNRVWDSLARERLARGCEVLGRGRVVITDRLHGHLLSLLLGIPHVVLGDRHGKVRNYYETWTRTGGVAPWAQTREEAATLALRLAGTEPHRCE